MALSNWEIFFTILIFSICILISSINGYFIYLSTKYKFKYNIIIKILISLSQLLAIFAFVIEILSFTLYTGSYELVVTTANWITFSAILVLLVTIIFIYKEKFNIKKPIKSSLKNKDILAP